MPFIQSTPPEEHQCPRGLRPPLWEILGHEVGIQLKQALLLHSAYGRITAKTLLRFYLRRLHVRCAPM
jgi:hypothetical protein